MPALLGASATASVATLTLVPNTARYAKTNTVHMQLYAETIGAMRGLYNRLNIYGRN